MPDTKITALAAITTVDPAADVLPIVDISDTSMAASGTTKKITSNQILGAGGTATLASATITGDLTVRTNKLAVTSTGVGAGTASPLSVFTVQSQASARLSVRTTDTVFGTVTGGTALDSLNGSDASLVPFGVRGSTVTLGSSAGIGFQIDASGNATWQNVGGVAGTAMTLNATGLAIGDTAFAGTRLTLRESASQPNALAMTNRNATQTWRIGVDVSAVDDKILGFYDSTSTTFRMQLTDTGNLGIGVTPSAWSAFKAIDIGTGSSISGASTTTALGFNNYWNGSNYIYKLTAAAGDYRQTAFGHAWFTAPSGTAGNAITFTERLRLKETGQLRFVPLASDPAGAEAGDVYYNSTSNKLKCYNGTTWNDLF